MNLRTFWLFLAVIFLSGAARPTLAQRIYDKDKDDQAQEAKKLAAEATSGSVFDKQLKNLKLITQQDFATYFMAAKRQMNLDINSFILWKDVADAVKNVKNNVGQQDPYPSKDIADIRQQLKVKSDDAAAKLKELKEKAKTPDDPTVPALFDRLGEVQVLLGLAGDLLQRESNATKGSTEASTLRAGVGEIGQALDALKGLYSTYLDKMNEIDQATRDLVALKIPMQKVALARLQVEEQHWKTVGAIQARRAADEADIILMLNDFEASIQNLGLAASLDELATVDTRLEDTLDDLITRTTDAQTTQQEYQGNLHKAAAKTREAEAELVKATRAVGEAQQKGGKKGIALAEKHLSETQQQMELNSAEENRLRSSIKAAKNEITEGRRRLAHILDVLYVASALSAHGSTPANLASLRLAQEEHRYSIRKSAVLAQAYEATITSGTQRLALYYKGGLKPEKIAQLIHSAATVAIPAAILAK
ncbi:MAG: hypothetical protein QOK48_3144 [Blastocatellia bacterium]|nr:hypothetical protein [Blastocatellia bacterium]